MTSKDDPSIPVRHNKRTKYRSMASMNGDHLVNLIRMERSNNIFHYNATTRQDLSRNLKVWYKGHRSVLDDLQRGQRSVYKVMCRVHQEKLRLLRQEHDKHAEEIKQKMNFINKDQPVRNAIEKFKKSVQRKKALKEDSREETKTTSAAPGGSSSKDRRKSEPKVSIENSAETSSLETVETPSQDFSREKSLKEALSIDAAADDNGERSSVENRIQTEREEISIQHTEEKKCSTSSSPKVSSATKMTHKNKEISPTQKRDYYFHFFSNDEESIEKAPVEATQSDNNDNDTGSVTELAKQDRRQATDVQMKKFPKISKAYDSEILPAVKEEGDVVNKNKVSPENSDSVVSEKTRPVSPKQTKRLPSISKQRKVSKTLEVSKRSDPVIRIKEAYSPVKTEEENKATGSALGEGRSSGHYLVNVGDNQDKAKEDTQSVEGEISTEMKRDHSANDVISNTRELPPLRVRKVGHIRPPDFYILENFEKHGVADIIGTEKTTKVDQKTEISSSASKSSAPSTRHSRRSNQKASLVKEVKTRQKAKIDRMSRILDRERVVHYVLENDGKLVAMMGEPKRKQFAPPSNKEVRQRQQLLKDEKNAEEARKMKVEKFFEEVLSLRDPSQETEKRPKSLKQPDAEDTHKNSTLANILFKVFRDKPRQKRSNQNSMEELAKCQYLRSYRPERRNGDVTSFKETSWQRRGKPAFYDEKRKLMFPVSYSGYYAKPVPRNVSSGFL